ncbi:MAG: hypothetical protein V1851_02320 [Patescibacteria group bacterium]
MSGIVLIKIYGFYRERGLEISKKIKETSLFDTRIFIMGDSIWDEEGEPHQFLEIHCSEDSVFSAREIMGHLYKIGVKEETFITDGGGRFFAYEKIKSSSESSEKF